MAQERDEDKVRLEAVLRRWGAAEAAQTAAIGSAPRRGAGVRLAALRRWAPLAAAAAALVAAVGFFLAAPGPQPPQKVAPARPTATFREELAALQGQHRKALAEMEDLRVQLRKDEKDLGLAKEEIALLQQKNELARQAAAQMKSLETRYQQVVDERVKAVQAEVQARNELAAAQKVVAAKDAELAKAHEREPLAQDAERYKNLYEVASAAKRAQETELATLKAGQAAMIEEFQRAYLELASRAARDQSAKAAWSQAGSELIGLRQEVIRQTQLLPRGVKVRQMARDEDARKLLDKLDVILTQLELLDVRDPSAVEAFRATLKGNNLAGEIEQVVVTSSPAPEVRAWLYEAMLVLTGVDRAG